MNSLRNLLHNDAQIAELLSATPQPEVPRPAKRIYEGPKFDGKRCTVCSRPFKSTAEFVNCKLCQAAVCRRKDQCKRLHHAEHYLAAKAQRKEEA